MVIFLVRTLSKKGVSEWYGKKIIGFLKLLIIDAPPSSIPISEFESNLSRCSHNHDKPEILTLICDLMEIVESKSNYEEKHSMFDRLR